MNVSELLARLTLSYAVLLLLTRLMGRKEISQMTFFNFISAIAIGTIAGSLVTNASFSIRNGIIALTGWTLFTIILGVLDIKSKKIRKAVEGDPLIVIKKGQILEGALRHTRLDVDALRAMLREKNVFALSDVEYAIFETDGKLSVMKKENKQTVTKQDMSMETWKQQMFPMATEIIADGVVNEDNMHKLNLNTEWLEQQLKQAGVRSASDVFYAEVEQDGTLYIDKRHDMLH